MSALLDPAFTGTDVLLAAAAAIAIIWAAIPHGKQDR